MNCLEHSKCISLSMPSVLEQSDVEPTKHSYLLKKYVVPIVFQFAYDWLAHLVETWSSTETNQSYPKGLSINYVVSLWGVAPTTIYYIDPTW